MSVNTAVGPRRGPTATQLPHLVGLSVAAALTIMLSVAIGSVFVSPLTVASIVWDHLTPGQFSTGATVVEERIVWQFRMPRALLAFVVGAGLAVSGAVLQAVVRNPLADPFIFGISAGASVMAVLVLTTTTIVSPLGVSGAAFIGALLASGIVFGVSRAYGRVTPLRLVLVGVSVGYVLAAVTSALILRASQPGAGLASVLTWLAGSLGAATWSDLGIPAVVAVLATGWLLLQYKSLNALLMGEEVATGLGVNLTRFRIQIFLVTALLVGVLVAVSGAIGFVGLMVPHVVRRFTGSDHRLLLLPCALVGGIFLVIADTVGRVVFAPTELPVGLVTALVGGPFVLWLLRGVQGGQ